jgi:hypothetical protein
MATSTDDLAARVERLEHLFEERTMDRPSASDRSEDDVHRFWARIPFAAWLKISGPTFAVMVLGFGALWNAQQATTQQIMDLQQSTTSRILELQESTAAKIFELQESTTDRILEMQQTTTDRMLDMQQQILDMNRESRAERG